MYIFINKAMLTKGNVNIVNHNKGIKIFTYFVPSFPHLRSQPKSKFRNVMYIYLD